MSTSLESTAPEADHNGGRPRGCDAETGGRVETVHGPVHIRIRRWGWCDGRYVRHEMLVETPRARHAGTGYLSIGAVEEITDAAVPDMLTAWMHASVHVADAAREAHGPRLAQQHAPDRAPSRPTRRGPDAPPAMEPAAPTTPRRVPPAKTYRNRGHALHAMLGACGYARAEHYALASAALGRDVDSLSGLTQTEDALVRSFADSTVPA